MKVIGILNSGTPNSLGEQFVAFHRGLKEAGFVEGQNVRVEYCWANNDYNLLGALAKELVDREVAVIVAAGGTVSAQRARDATKNIPVVFTAVTDPEKSGLKAANLTGMWGLTSELDSKRLELLHEFKPEAKSIGVLVHSRRDRNKDQFALLNTAAAGLNLQLVPEFVANERDIDTAIDALASQNVGALLVTADPFFNSRRTQIVAVAKKLKVPAIYQWSGFVAAGGLMSYGPRIRDAYRLAGVYAGRILAGAKPADLPIVLPAKFNLVINFEKAKAFGGVRPELFTCAIKPPEEQPKAEIVIISTSSGA